jgi:hypothetical protein
VSKAAHRRALAELEGLIAHPGWEAIKASLIVSQQGVHAQLVHANTPNDKRGSLAGEYRAYENMITLPERTMRTLRARIDDDQGDSDG